MEEERCGAKEGIRAKDEGDGGEVCLVDVNHLFTALLGNLYIYCHVVSLMFLLVFPSFCILNRVTKTAVKLHFYVVKCS